MSTEEAREQMCRLRKHLLGWGLGLPLCAHPHTRGWGEGGGGAQLLGNASNMNFWNMTHIPIVTLASASCFPSGRAESAKGAGDEQGKDLYLQIDQADAGVAFVWGALGSQTAPRLPGRETAALAAAKLTCALWCVTIDFLPTTLRLDTAIPVTYVSALLFTQPCSPFWAVICCTTISRFLIDLFKMLDATGCAQLSHIKFPEPRVQLGSW